MSVTKRYRETTTGDHYTIRYESQSDGMWKIYADAHPANSFDSSVSKCHLYSSSEICVFAGKEPRTMDRAQAIAFVWMEGYSQYVRSGSFPTGKKRVRI